MNVLLKRILVFLMDQKIDRVIIMMTDLYSIRQCFQDQIRRLYFVFYRYFIIRNNLKTGFKFNLLPKVNNF